MKQKRKKSKKWITRLFLLILLIVAGVVAFLVWDAYFSDKKKDEKIDNTEIMIEEESGGDKNIEDDTTEDLSEDLFEKKVIQYDGENPNSAEELSGAITYAAVSGDKITIRVNIDQYLNEGSCRLGLLKEGVEYYSEVVQVVDSVATATCQGFDVLRSQLEPGNYRIIVDVESAGKTGTIKGEVSV